MTIRYKVSFANRNGICGTADLAFEDLVKFSMRNNVVDLKSYVVGRDDPYPRKNTPDPDMDYDKSRHRCS